MPVNKNRNLRRRHTRKNRNKLRKNKRKTHRGGSPASSHVMSLLKPNCNALKLAPLTPATNDNLSGANLYQTTGGGNRKRRSNKRRNSNKRRKNRSKGGGSDWLGTLYSRGPINTPGMSECQFRAFTKTAPYVPNNQFQQYATVNSALTHRGGKRKRNRNRKSNKKSNKN